MDRLLHALKDGLDVCTTGVLTTALTCMESSDMNRCQGAEFVTNHFEECGKIALPADRRLEEAAALLQLQTLPDGAQEADLSKSPADLLDALAKQTRMDSMSSVRLVFNMTSKQRAIYDKDDLETE